ncbi:hypothetical protein [Arthrobacter sp. B3I4]|uniref:hypothetical protein n=1 Tax=Arthrobacter sp. B3I4 TaxID=3042267 RepID=UPI00277ECFAC|nr:hypothetical protein [Arthrobacter sp. B3I4]MDQ0756120.1 hypothetical protein [Arthrobacter sp. B3I4]
MSKDEALSTLASAHEAAVEAESAASAAQDRKRAAVRQAFDAGCTAPEVAAVLGSSAQWAYQLRDKPPLNAA